MGKEFVFWLATFGSGWVVVSEMLNGVGEGDCIHAVAWRSRMAWTTVCLTGIRGRLVFSREAGTKPR